MNNIYPYLNDISFLNELFHFKRIIYYTKITALDWNENAIQSIEGKVISASFNVDSSSSVRRTGNITLLIEKMEGAYSIQSLFSINKKINAEIGLKNTTSKYVEYPIIWFPLGIYLIKSVSLQRSTTSLTIQLQLQDKMSLLNGDCGGIIPAATVFDNYQTIDDNGNYVISRPTIYQIILELVNHFGKEPLHKIIIADLESRIKQVMKWSGSTPLYMVQKGNQYQMSVDPNDYLSWKANNWTDVEGSPFEYGSDVGYIYTDFSFPGDLIGQAGESISSILDKIISVLGNYEYFYDVYGNFHFQQIKNYLNNSHAKFVIQALNNTQGNLSIENYLLDNAKGKSVYNFDDLDLIISYTNAPQYNMIKNDFIIWGNKTTVNSNKIPIRYHLAIDKKPQIGNTYEVFSYTDPNDKLLKWHYPIQFTNRNNFPEVGVTDMFYYDKSSNKIYKWDKNDNLQNDYILLDAKLQQVTTKDWRTQLYLQGVIAEALGTDVNPYYAQLKNEWPKIYNIVPNNSNGTNDSDFKEQMLQDVTRLDYFLDFIDTDSDIMELSVENIGKRTTVFKDNVTNCIFEPIVPDVVFINTDSDIETNILREQCQNRNQSYYQVPLDIYELLVPGGHYFSAYQVIRQMLHEYTSYNQNISLTCIPLYFLQVNTRIGITDSSSGIAGDYIIKNFNINIDTGSTMTLSAVKALQKK